jgi:hypothetical protein
LGWMAAKAQALGLTMDPTTAAQFATLPSQYALDVIRQSWTPPDGPPHLRPIAPNAEVANSVAVRIQYALTYTPANLQIISGALGSGYTQVNLVDTSAF